MALVKCPECGSIVSSLAYACTLCGFPMREQTPQGPAEGTPEKTPEGPPEGTPEGPPEPAAVRQPDQNVTCLEYVGALALGLFMLAAALILLYLCVLDWSTPTDPPDIPRSGG